MIDPKTLDEIEAAAKAASDTWAKGGHANVHDLKDKVLILSTALRSAQAEIERFRARPSTSQAIEAVEATRDYIFSECEKELQEAGGGKENPDHFAHKKAIIAAWVCELLSNALAALPADPFNPLSYAAGARRAVDLAKRLVARHTYASGLSEELESRIEAELAGSAGAQS